MTEPCTVTQIEPGIVKMESPSFQDFVLVQKMGDQFHICGLAADVDLVAKPMIERGVEPVLHYRDVRS